MPDRHGVAPGWGSRTFPRGDNGLSVLASGWPEDASSEALKLNADAAALAGTLAKGQSTEFSLAPGRAAYLVPVDGAVTVNGIAAQPRDGVAISDDRSVTITATAATELVVVEVAA
jgi:redox-sensitive bicupin YhaK (pirin superfamily)